ncbi:hypothetical protein LP52_04945 [Streptomonospora alba]|uniref:FAD-binding domain-containing protein n=1 Tax=Streptomonospora alba TaxID=183763 RepID=A0A0C2JSN4_9ACTN|nr:FAD-dependent monooxygenase [Streptomonospora alba]KIH99852.1 hypothetical protein LP52_04945 [Streptomonospora alba]
MFDAIVAGGGPTGMFLACELKLAGADPVVLESLPGINQEDKAHGLTGQVVRLLDHRGLFQRCSRSSVPTPAPAFFFGALPLPLHVLGTDNPMYLLPINQRDLERLLNERAADLGIDVRRGCELRSFTQSDDRVDVLVSDGAEGKETTLTTRFLVGCDGARSLVRKQSGIGFPGYTDAQIVDRTALIAPSEQFRPAPGGRVHVRGFGDIPANFHRTEHGVVTIGLLDPEHPLVHTVEWEDHPAGDFPGPGERMTLTEMEASIERILGAPVTLTPPPDGAPTLLRRVCGRNTRVAERYRDRRVFLAGDAAHVHAASGGPGLNLGLQDAANLAWKLAADLHAWAPNHLLDTYGTERHALGRRVFMQTQAQTALMAPGGDVTALRELFSEFLTDRENVQRIADLMAGADVRYDMGDDGLSAPTGRFAPSLDFATHDGCPMRLAELLRDAQPVLLDLTGGDELAAAIAPWNDRVVRVAGRAEDPPAPAMLIRPDGYVAWSGTDSDTLRSALTCWFGTATAVSSAPSASFTNSGIQ